MALPSVSICITSYNYADYVGAAVQSALDQTYDRVEVVVVDDGSPDGSLAVLQAFGDRIKLVAQRNTGRFIAGRNAVDAASGDVVIFLDSDDLIDATTAARVAEAFAENPGASRVQWRLRVVGPDGTDTGSLFPPAGWRLTDGDLSRHVVRRRTYVWPSTSAGAYPRGLLQRLMTVEEGESPPVSIDVALAETTPLFGPIVTIPGVGGSYRYHFENETIRERRDWPVFLRTYIEQMARRHARLRRLACDLPIDVPEDPLEALDWALLSYRLASLRIDPEHHPLAGDAPLRLAGRGAYAVLTQPDYSWPARLKRAAWFAAMAVAPSSLVPRLVLRMFGRPLGNVDVPHPTTDPLTPPAPAARKR